MNLKTKTTVTAALFAALICITTLIIKIPSPFKGYMNLGDCVVLLSGWLLPPFYSFFAAAIGSALADIFSGYIIYVPITFVIKGLMALCANLIFNKAHNFMGATAAAVIGGIAAEILMSTGYYIFEGILYGFIPSLAGIPANIVQGIAGLITGLLLLKLLKVHISKK
ncbi:MAG: ECF transporter S component [Clostridia bacterium]|nr:ECF transporter S component [Clostridia bacterium]